MPRLSDTMEEGTILRWLGRDGEEIQRGQELVEIETDKATMVYESDQQGTLEILAQEGQTLAVGELIVERSQVSLPLAVLALLLSTAIAFPIGLIAAARRGRVGERVLMSVTQLGLAVPNFWLGMLLVMLFAVGLHWVSAGGFPGWDAGFWACLKALTLPAIALAMPQAAILARVLRGSLIDTLHEDYIRTARAKGAGERQVLWRHALPNALVPVLTILGMQFSFLLAGGVIIENVFYLPGLGRLVFQAIVQRDLIVVQSVVVLLVFAVVTVTFLVDLSYVLANPRLRAPGAV